MKSVLYGGSFDPVHDGHVAAVKLLRARYGRVIVMPAFVSPFKSGTRALDADRLAMLKLVFDGTDGVETSDYEIGKGGVSYTYETLRAYPDAAFAVGGDSMNTLVAWARADELRSREVALIGRVGVDCDAARAAWIAAGGSVVDVGTALDASSTLARFQLSVGRPALVPAAVRDYVNAQGLYPYWREITDRFAEFSMKPSRIAHTYGVAETACRLAERNGVDAEKAIRASLLHDIAKYLTLDQARSMGVVPSPGALDSCDAVRHAHLGADVAEQIMHEAPDIVDAIRWHTTARAGMSKLTAIVTLADYIEPGRDFAGVERVRERAFCDLDGAVVTMLDMTMKHLLAKGADVDPATKEAYEYYLKSRSET